jgi:hypothetical protein
MERKFDRGPCAVTSEDTVVDVNQRLEHIVVSTCLFLQLRGRSYVCVKEFPTWSMILWHYHLLFCVG